jgi:energy-coupling factor transport system permease protein
MTACLDRPSSVGRLDPRVKLAWSVVVSLLAVMLGRPVLLAGLLFLTLLPWLLVRPPWPRVRPLFPLVLMMCVGSMISQGFFYAREPRTEWLRVLPGLSLSREGVIYGAVVSLRLVAVLSAGSLVVFTTHPSEMVLGLARLRVPHGFAFMLTLALRFLPETVEQGKRILVAQQLRGAGGAGILSAPRRFRLLIVPLLAASLRSARQVAMAAEVRAYSPTRVAARELRFSTTDWAVLVGLGLLLLAGAWVTLFGSAMPVGGLL